MCVPAWIILHIVWWTFAEHVIGFAYTWQIGNCVSDLHLHRKLVIYTASRQLWSDYALHSNCIVISEYCKLSNRRLRIFAALFWIPTALNGYLRTILHRTTHNSFAALFCTALRKFVRRTILDYFFTNLRRTKKSFASLFSAFFAAFAIIFRQVFGG